MSKILAVLSEQLLTSDASDALALRSPKEAALRILLSVSGQPGFQDLVSNQLCNREIEVLSGQLLPSDHDLSKEHLQIKSFAGCSSVATEGRQSTSGRFSSFW